MNDRQAGNQRSLPSAVRGYLSAHWAMEETAHACLMQRLAAVVPSDLKAFWDEEDDPLPSPAKPAKKAYQIASGVAVLPLVGVLQKREDWFTRWFGGEGTALEPWIKSLQQAAADPDVTDIVVKSDSPGGTVDGTKEAADAVYAVRQAGKKRIVAVSSGICCSGAYWICSQASELWAGETDWTGSIGTRLGLMDTSAFYETLGIKFDYITSGEFKAAGADGVPITDAVRAYFQQLVDRLQQEFTTGVARGRKMPIDQARGIAKEARVYVGSDATAAGLIDGMATVEEVVTRLQKSGGKTTGAGARTGGGARVNIGSIIENALRSAGVLKEPEGETDTSALEAKVAALEARETQRVADEKAAREAAATERKTRIETEAKVFADALPAGLRPAARTNAEKAFTALAMVGSDEGIAALKASFEGVPDVPLTGERVRVMTLPDRGGEGGGGFYAGIRAEGEKRNGTGVK